MHHIESNNSPTKVGIIKIAIVAIAIICFIVWERYFAPTLEQETFEAALPMTFHGRVGSIYRDKANHDVKKVILSDGYVYGIYAP